MMMSVAPSSGSTKDLVGDMNTPILVRSTSTSSARYTVHNPPRSLPWCAYRTMPTVSSTSPGWASGELEME